MTANLIRSPEPPAKPTKPVEASATELVAEARRQGVELRAVGSKLQHRGTLDGDLRAALLGRRDEVLRVLAAEREEPPPEPAPALAWRLFSRLLERELWLAVDLETAHALWVETGLAAFLLDEVDELEAKPRELLAAIVAARAAFGPRGSRFADAGELPPRPRPAGDDVAQPIESHALGQVAVEDGLELPEGVELLKHLDARHRRSWALRQDGEPIATTDDWREACRWIHSLRLGHLPDLAVAEPEQQQLDLVAGPVRPRTLWAHRLIVERDLPETEDPATGT